MNDVYMSHVILYITYHQLFCVCEMYLY